MYFFTAIQVIWLTTQKTSQITITTDHYLSFLFLSEDNKFSVLKKKRYKFIACYWSSLWVCVISSCLPQIVVLLLNLVMGLCDFILFPTNRQEKKNYLFHQIVTWLMVKRSSSAQSFLLLGITNLPAFHTQIWFLSYSNLVLPLKTVARFLFFE